MATLLDLIREAHPEWQTSEDVLASVVRNLTDDEFAFMCAKYRSEPDVIEHLKRLRERKATA